MKVIDNAPTDKPCIGKLIEEDCAVGQFADNCIYLIAQPETDIARDAMDIMELYKRRINDNDYYNAYELEVVPHVELKNHPKIRERIEQYGDNCLIQLPMFSREGKKRFICAYIDREQLRNNVWQMICQAEWFAKADAIGVLKTLVIEVPDCFETIAREFVSDKKFLSKYFGSLVSDMTHPCHNMVVSFRSIKERLHIDDIISHKRLMRSFDHLLTNLKCFHKNNDPEIEAELDMVFSVIDPATLKLFISKQSPGLQKKFVDFVNPRRLAEASTMDLEIRWSADIDKTHKNDGHYRLYLKKGDERQMVHFSRSAGFILYLIYLLDRKKNGDKVDTLNILHYKQLFAKLYEKTYGANGETTFADMVKNYNAEGKVQQKVLYNVISSMRKDVGMVCERMLEPAEPFVPRDITAHLTVLPEHIIIPNELLELW